MIKVNNILTELNLLNTGSKKHLVYEGKMGNEKPKSINQGRKEFKRKIRNKELEDEEIKIIFEGLGDDETLTTLNLGKNKFMYEIIVAYMK